MIICCLSRQHARREHEISVQVRHSGKHLVRYTDERGRSKAKTFEANEKRAAQAFDAEMKRRRRHGEVVSPSEKTLAELRVDWLNSPKGQKLSPKTMEFYDGMWTKYIEPELGRASVCRITTLILDEFVSDLEKRGVGQATITKCLTQLSSMFRVAMKYRLIPTNPMQYVDRPEPKPSRIIRPLTPDQVERIRAQMKPRDALLVSLLAYSGIRPGEALALKWGSIHDDTFRIETAISLGEEKDTKTGEPRDVKLLAPLKQELLEHRLSIGRPSDSTLIFPARGGGHWSSSDWRNFRQRPFADAVEAIGLAKTTRPYDLRHSAASLFISAGRNPVYLARQMGHKPSMLLDRYSHVFEEFEDQTIDPEAQILAARACTGAAQAAS